jgi:hypothetical protein
MTRRPQASRPASRTAPGVPFSWSELETSLARQLEWVERGASWHVEGGGRHGEAPPDLRAVGQRLNPERAAGIAFPAFREK